MCKCAIIGCVSPVTIYCHPESELLAFKLLLRIPSKHRQSVLNFRQFYLCPNIE